ncbi:MAG TPA: DUF1572 family protein [Bryocella sp.]|nr:DUF1572 family protein [Bryocella sp.]
MSVLSSSKDRPLTTDDQIMPFDIASLYLQEVLRGLESTKRLAEGAMAQLSDKQFFALPSPEETSVAMVVKHMAGNLRSRFTDFLTSDGEKPDRNRDQEFIVEAQATREQFLCAWEGQWQLLFDTIRSLGPDDLNRTVTIRNQPHSVLQALQRAAGHMAYHTGQIVFLAKHWQGAQWKSLSIPKGQSEQVNAAMREKYKNPT